MDQVYEDLHTGVPGKVVKGRRRTGPIGSTDAAILDEDTVGLGQFYCPSCRYYI